MTGRTGVIELRLQAAIHLLILLTLLSLLLYVPDAVRARIWVRAGVCALRFVLQAASKCNWLSHLGVYDTVTDGRGDVSSYHPAAAASAGAQHGDILAERSLMNAAAAAEIL